jgi:hypothetical protein
LVAAEVVLSGHNEFEISEALPHRLVGEGCGRDDKALQADYDARSARVRKGFPDESLERQDNLLDS